MANKNPKGGPRARLFLLPFCLPLLLLCLSSPQLCAQDISDSYISSIQPQGTLYFIKPIKGFENKDTDSEFIFDITTYSYKDTAILNFSFYDERVLTPDSLVLVSGENRLAVPVKKLFVESEKSVWEYRCTTVLPASRLASLVHPQLPLIILLKSDKGLVRLTIKDRKWEKEGAALEKIFALIAMNRKE